MPTLLTTPTTVSTISQPASTTTTDIQQQANVLADAQQQAKLVFNVETDKATPPLQLYLQIPQGQQAPQNTSNLNVNQPEQQSITATQAIAQTQTGLPVTQNAIVLPSNLQQQPQIMATQLQGQHCNLHSQVNITKFMK